MSVQGKDAPFLENIVRDAQLFGGAFATAVGVGYLVGDIGLFAIPVGAIAGLVGGFATHLLLPHPVAAPLPPEELKRRIKAFAREAIDSIDPPLTGEGYREACGKLYSAIKDEMSRVTLRHGDRRIDVPIENDGKKIYLTVKERDRPCP